ncbi:MAG: CoA pyrophosphatase [Ideonella sp.]|nr:MAG: CoA pyrophosphatase [Burkholderiaceae bacterium]MBE7427784.1 CoA pyrophosphatase [Ideonella sp.]
MRVPPPRVRDPKIYPVVGIDDYLPALPAQALTPEAVSRRFADAHPWTPEFRGDARLFAIEREPTPASVLVPLVERDGGLNVLLTRRADHLHDHAGQISFPGGRADPGDASAIDTALREAREEVGLPRERVQVLGPLNTYSTVTSYVVTPVVALVWPPFELALDAFEVAEAFEVPLQFLMTPAHHHRHAAEFDGVKRQFLSMPWQGIDAQGRPHEYFIWGATAAMLRNLYQFLR